MTKFLISSETIVKMTIEETREICNEWHERLSSQSFTDSARLLREDRDRWIEDIKKLISV